MGPTFMSTIMASGSTDWTVIILMVHVRRNCENHGLVSCSRFSSASCYSTGKDTDQVRQGYESPGVHVTNKGRTAMLVKSLVREPHNLICLQPGYTLFTTTGIWGGDTDGSSDPVISIFLLRILRTRGPRTHTPLRYTPSTFKRLILGFFPRTVSFHTFPFFVSIIISRLTANGLRRTSMLFLSELLQIAHGH